MYGLGEIIEQLEISNSNTFRLYILLKRMTPEEEPTDRSYSLSELANEKVKTEIKNRNKTKCILALQRMSY